jgi:hypothetical protein
MDSLTHSSRRVTKYVNRGNSTTIIKQTMESVPDKEYLPLSLQELFISLLVQCTVIETSVKFTNRENTA